MCASCSLFRLMDFGVDGSYFAVDTIRTQRDCSSSYFVTLTCQPQHVYIQELDTRFTQCMH